MPHDAPIGWGHPASPSAASIDVGRAHPNVPPWPGVLIRSSRARSRRPIRRGGKTAAPRARRAPCSTGRRRRAGAPATRTRSRCGAGAAPPRSSPSSRWSRRHPVFGTFRAQSGSGGFYEVEVRSLDAFANSCGCIDHRVNGLGTCKHIEGVLAALRQRGARKFRAAAAQGSAARRGVPRSPRRCRVRRCCGPPSGGRELQAARRFLAPFLAADGTLARDPDTIQALFSAWHAAPADMRRLIRLSRHFTPWLERAAPRPHARRGARGVPRRGRGRRRQPRSAAPSAAALSARGHAASRLRGARAARRRDGAGQDRAGDRRLRAARPPQGHRPRAGGLPGLAQGRVGGADRALHRAPDARGVRSAAGAAPAYREPAFFNIVNYEQVLSDAADINDDPAPRRGRARRGAAHQELADQDRAAGEVAALALCLRAHRHAGREPHRRALLDRAVPRPRAGRSAVPLQPRLLRARRARPAGRLQEPRRAARAPRSR